jgi:hypothetical protein
MRGLTLNILANRPTNINCRVMRSFDLILRPIARALRMQVTLKSPSRGEIRFCSFHKTRGGGGWGAEAGDPLFY